jgi:hypothetical protein
MFRQREPKMSNSDKNAVFIIAIACGLSFVAYVYIRDAGISTAAGWALHRDATSMFTTYLRWLWW